MERSDRNSCSGTASEFIWVSEKVLGTDWLGRTVSKSRFAPRSGSANLYVSAISMRIKSSRYEIWCVTKCYLSTSSVLFRNSYWSETIKTIGQFLRIWSPIFRSLKITSEFNVPWQ